MNGKSFKVAIAGATGAVGGELLRSLAQRSFPVASLRLFASRKSVGRTIEFQGQKIAVEELGEGGFGDCDIVFLATSAALSRSLAVKALQSGSLVIDNSSAFRHDPNAALVVPELNADSIPAGPGIIANPNCSTIITLMAVGPLAKSFGLDRLIASTYQAVSGAGASGLTELADSTASLSSNTEFTPKTFSAPIAENLIPWVGDAALDGWTDEELKMSNESRKILDINDLEVFCTCVRVPVARAHSVSIHVKLKTAATNRDILSAWESMPGLQVIGDSEAGIALTPRSIQGQEAVACGRLRRLDNDGFEWTFFVVGDQLLKGAAQNAVQIAEHWAGA